LFYLKLLISLELEVLISGKTFNMFSGTHDGEQRGTSYIRWGRKTCENNATLVYRGMSAACRPHVYLWSRPTLYTDHLIVMMWRKSKVFHSSWSVFC